MPSYFGIINRAKEPKTISQCAHEGIEQIIVVGHLGKDPDSRFAGNGKAITRGSLAVSWGKRGENQVTEWVSFTAWEQQADALAQFRKGDAVLLIGKPSIREYNGKEYAELTVWSVAKPIWKTDQQPDRGMPPIPPTEKQQVADEDDDDSFSIPF